MLDLHLEEELRDTAGSEDCVILDDVLEKKTDYLVSILQSEHELQNDSVCRGQQVVKGGGSNDTIEQLCQRGGVSDG